MSRTLARYRFRRNARQPSMIDSAPRQRPTIAWLRRSVRLAYWNEAWTTREALLERINRLQAKVGRPAVGDVGWNDADLTLEPGALTRVEIKTADEEHSGNRMKNHVAIRARLMPVTRGALWLSTIAATVAAIAGYSAAAIAGAAVAVGLAACSAAEVIAAIRMAYLVVEQSAGELGLVPLGRPTAVAKPAGAQPRSVPRRQAAISHPSGQ
jgi:hypothetical protein